MNINNFVFTCYPQQLAFIGMEFNDQFSFYSIRLSRSFCIVSASSQEEMINKCMDHQQIML